MYLDLSLPMISATNYYQAINCIIIIHGQAKKVTWGVSSQGAMSKICRPPSAAGKFFTWGASSLGTFAIFKLSAPILEGGGTHFTLGSVHFSPFLLRELQGRVKKFSAALPRRHPREAAPPYFFTSGVDQKKFFTQGCTPPLPPPLPMYDENIHHQMKCSR